MALRDLWETAPDQLREKHINQVIAFAGSGKLRDSGDASLELRDFLSLVPSTFLSRYATECLTEKFEDSGLALQDVVNETGRRLGFEVENGVYRGSSKTIGFDGIWRSEGGKAIVVEVKTTDAYRIDLDTIAQYRTSLTQEGTILESGSSMLIVVGRQDTGDLEAQIRGSRHAWDTRLISVDALHGLMKLKENLEEPIVVQKIRDILSPREYTKVDGIIDIVFATAEDVRYGDEPSEDHVEDEDDGEARRSPAAFHDACIERVESVLGRRLVRRSRTMYSSADGSLIVVCAVSRPHGSQGTPSYWYAFHPHQNESLKEGKDNFVAFGCGSEENILLIPLADFGSWLEGMNKTEKPDRFYWHVKIANEDGKYVLHRKKGYERVDLTPYLLA